jgi:4-hydroxythreonine-4-phosphate dehydrogenase
MASNEFRPGEISEANGRAAYAYLETSVRLAKAGRVDALVTAPVSKEAIKAAHSHFSDQATYFASAFGLDPESPVTMVVSGRLRCFLVTKHIPLADVSAALNIDRISRVCLLAHSTLRQLGVKEPRLAVASLNPHVGEGGLIGTEEIKIIRPAIESLITKVEIAPTLTTGKAAFELLMEGTADGVIAMYHDQSAPVELLGGVTATVTLGLPIVRTSVGHGTAFDIAWTGTASPAALAMAIDSAITLVRS